MTAPSLDQRMKEAKQRAPLPMDLGLMQEKVMKRLEAMGRVPLGSYLRWKKAQVKP